MSFFFCCLKGKVVNFRLFSASEFEINNEQILCSCDVHVLDLHCTEHIHQILILFMIGVAFDKQESPVTLMD